MLRTSTARPRPTGVLGRRTAVLLAVLVPALVATACGDDSADSSAPAGTLGSSASPSASYPVQLTAGPNAELTLAKQPTSIVSLSPTGTEVLFAVGAGDQVKAVDDQSTFPTDAPKTKLSGFQPNVEAIAGYAPDLVVLSNDSNGVVAGLKKLSIPVYLMPAPDTLDKAYAQWVELGRVVGHSAAAEDLVSATEERIDKVVADLPAGVQGTSVYHELDQTYYSAASSTFIGNLYTTLGLTNIADEAAKKAGPYPQLSAETVIKAAPKLIVLADTKCCGQTPETVAKRPGFSAVPAVQNGKVIPVDDDVASRWGPRIADLAEQLGVALKS